MHAHATAALLPGALQLTAANPPIFPGRSVFYLPPPRALNYLVAEKFGGPTLVLQASPEGCTGARPRGNGHAQALCGGIAGCATGGTSAVVPGFGRGSAGFCAGMKGLPSTNALLSPLVVP